MRGRAFGTVLLVGSLGDSPTPLHPARPVRAGMVARRSLVMPEQGLLVWCMSNRSRHVVYTSISASHGSVVLAAKDPLITK